MADERKSGTFLDQDPIVYPRSRFGIQEFPTFTTRDCLRFVENPRISSTWRRSRDEVTRIRIWRDARVRTLSFESGAWYIGQNGALLSRLIGLREGREKEVREKARIKENYADRRILFFFNSIRLAGRKGEILCKEFRVGAKLEQSWSSKEKEKNRFFSTIITRFFNAWNFYTFHDPFDDRLEVT